MMADCSVVNLSLLFGLSETTEVQLGNNGNHGRNFSACEYGAKFEYGLDHRVQISLLCLYMISLVLAVGGNLTILFIIIKLLSRSTTKTFICSLCLSDTVLFLVCVPFTVVSDLIFMYWPFWAVLCPVITFLQVATVLQRAFTLLALTLDKHYVAWRPLGKRLTHKSAKIVIVCIWIVSGAVAAPSAAQSRVRYLEYEPGSNGLCIELWSNHTSQRGYSYALLFLQYILPVLVMACSYTHIACIIWSKTPPGEKIFHRDKRIAKTKRKAVKMLMAVVIAYVVCWLPLHVLTLIGEKDSSIFNNPYVHYLWLLAHWLATSNSAVNPIVYFWMNPDYRAGLKTLLSVCCSNRRPSRSRDGKYITYLMRANKIVLCLTYKRDNSEQPLQQCDKDVSATRTSIGQQDTYRSDDLQEVVTKLAT